MIDPKIGCLIFLVGLLIGWRGCITYLQIQFKKPYARNKYEFKNRVKPRGKKK